MREDGESFKKPSRGSAGKKNRGFYSPKFLRAIRARSAQDATLMVDSLRVFTMKFLSGPFVGGERSYVIVRRSVRCKRAQ